MRLTRWQEFKFRSRHIWWRRLPWLVRRPIDMLVGRLTRGARSVKMGNLDATKGCLHEGGIDVEFGGACPVQGDGEVDGRVVYYRSRGIGWTFSVAPDGSEDALGANCWEYAEDKYHWPQGGWVHADVSRECIRRAVSEWRGAGRP